jgi:sec-independent protein translocase protein TatB
VSDVGLGELLVLAVVGLLVFGPDRLPEMARQAGAWLRDVRAMVAKARAEVSEGIGVDPSYLANPKAALSRELLGDGSTGASDKGVTQALGLDEVADAAASVDPRRSFDPDAT